MKWVFNCTSLCELGAFRGSRVSHSFYSRYGSRGIRFRGESGFVLKFRSPESLPKLEAGACPIYNPRRDSDWGSHSDPRRISVHLLLYAWTCGLLYRDVFQRTRIVQLYVLVLLFNKERSDFEERCYGDVLLSCGQSCGGCSEQRVSESRAHRRQRLQCARERRWVHARHFKTITFCSNSHFHAFVYSAWNV